MLVASFGRYAPESSLAAFGMMIFIASFIMSNLTGEPPRPEFIAPATTFVLTGSGLAVAQEIKRRRNGGG